jgi:hypothetical protein
VLSAKTQGFEFVSSAQIIVEGSGEPEAVPIPVTP